ncbi:MAG: PPC domain-containing protein, partial [Thermoanaerobaculia bacterium]
MKRFLCSPIVFFLAAAAVSVAVPAFDAGAAPQLQLRSEAKSHDLVTGDKALDPAMRADKDCVLMTIACNSTVTGVLDGTDCELTDGTRIDFWDFQSDQGATVTINMTSGEFDTFLFLLDPDLEDIVQDDDGGTGTNSRIQRTLPVGGTWSIGANGYDTTDLGNYTVQLQCSGGTQTAPAAPSNLTATTRSSTEIRLVWNDNANNENE